jgi:hypothetical protein
MTSAVKLLLSAVFVLWSAPLTFQTLHLGQAVILVGSLS